MAVGAWGISPRDYWGMDLQEWSWLFAVKKPQRTGDWAGTLTDAQVIELSRGLDEALEKHGKN